MRRVAHVPQPHRVVGAARGQRLAVRAERDRVHRVGRARQGAEPDRVAGRLTSHNSTTRRAPAAARIFPSGLNEVAYSGLSLAGASGAPTGTGCPGEATFHSRSVPSAAAAASSVRSGLSADRLDHAGGVQQPGGERGARRLQQARGRLRGMSGVVGGDAEVRGQRRVLTADLAGLDGDLAGAGVVAGGGRRLTLHDASNPPARRRPRPAPPARRPGAAACGYGGVRHVRSSAPPRPTRR